MKQKTIVLYPDEVWTPGQNFATIKEVEDTMCMRNNEDDGSQFVGYRTLRIEIPGENREYIFRGELYEFRNLPCKFEIDYCDLETWNDDGDTIDVDDIPREDAKTMWMLAEKIGVEQPERLEHE